LIRKLGLQFLNLPGLVLDSEEAVHVDGAALVDVFTVHMRQT
jgi:hypothetical protein